MNSLKDRWSRRLNNTKLNIREDLSWRGYEFLLTLSDYGLEFRCVPINQLMILRRSWYTSLPLTDSLFINSFGELIKNNGGKLG